MLKFILKGVMRIVSWLPMRGAHGFGSCAESQGVGKTMNSTRLALFIWLPTMGLLAACTTHDVAETVIDDAEVLVFLDPDLRPEVLLFPEYLLLEGFELDQHGRIPGTTLVGVELKADRSLQDVLQQIQDLLLGKGWAMDHTEVAAQSFRLMATRQGDQVEVRAIQGTGSTQVFILFRPPPTPQKTN